MGALRSFTSNFAILDVKRGRRQLRDHFADRPPLGSCPPAMRVPVTITGYIDCIHGSDDGTSQEFAVTVTQLEIDALPSGADHG
ncbi:hypothetical protein ACFPOB_29565 [Bosea eneae]|uniref:Uncharacterized protein n=1 Tax=Bosea eneae TaxID=151454 RepID=A0ABW0J210_9HYPH